MAKQFPKSCSGGGKMDSTVLTHSKAVDDEVMEQYEAITSPIRPERRMEASVYGRVTEISGHTHTYTHTHTHIHTCAKKQYAHTSYAHSEKLLKQLCALSVPCANPGSLAIPMNLVSSCLLSRSPCRLVVSSSRLPGIGFIGYVTSVSPCPGNRDIRTQAKINFNKKGGNALLLQATAELLDSWVL